MNEWSSFFSTMAEAAATLTGLIFVGASINLAKILSIPVLPDRALESLILLLNILIVSTHALIPHQTAFSFGSRLIGLSCLLWFFMIYLDVRIWHKSEKQYRRHSLQNMVFSQLAVVPFMLSGLMMLSNGYSAVYWLVPGIIISFIKAVVDAWVLLVEIHR